MDFDCASRIVHTSLMLIYSRNDISFKEKPIVICFIRARIYERQHTPIDLYSRWFMITDHDLPYLSSSEIYCSQVQYIAFSVANMCFNIDDLFSIFLRIRLNCWIILFIRIILLLRTSRLKYKWVHHTLMYFLSSSSRANKDFLGNKIWNLTDFYSRAYRLETF